MKKLILIPLAALALASCSTPSGSNSGAATNEGAKPAAVRPTALEGTWTGREMTPGHEGPASMLISGQNLEFHGPAGDDDWIKGTFSLREDANPKQFVGVITQCASPDYIGEKCLAIYKIENGTMTIAGNGPGDPNMPAAFDTPGVRQFVLKHE